MTDKKTEAAADSKPDGKINAWRYQGDGERTYPHHRHPETGHVLTVEPLDVFDFGDDMPPGDGLWYDVSSGAPYTSSPASTGAGETEE